MLGSFQVKQTNKTDIENIIENKAYKEVLTALNKEINFYIGEYYSNTGKPFLTIEDNSIYLYYLVKQGYVGGNTNQVKNSFKHIKKLCTKNKLELTVDSLEFNNITCNVEGSVIDKGKNIINFKIIDSATLLLSVM